MQRWRRIRAWLHSVEDSVERTSAESWERSIVIAIGASALLAACVTWAAVTVGSQAQDGDRQVIAQTIAHEQASANAAIRGAWEWSAAADYLAERGEAGALAGSPEAARWADAADLGTRSQSELAFDGSYLGVAQGQFLGQQRERGLAEFYRGALLNRQLPEQAKAAADRVHWRAEALSWAVCALVGVTLLLTVARVARPTRRPRLLVAAGTIGLVDLVLVAFWAW